MNDTWLVEISIMDFCVLWVVKTMRTVYEISNKCNSIIFNISNSILHEYKC